MARHIPGAGRARRVHNIVLMGSGEPLDNYDNVVRLSAAWCNAPEGLNMSLRNISLSTCGLVRRHAPAWRRKVCR